MQILRKGHEAGRGGQLLKDNGRRIESPLACDLARRVQSQFGAVVNVVQNEECAQSIERILEGCFAEVIVSLMFYLIVTFPPVGAASRTPVLPRDEIYAVSWYGHSYAAQVGYFLFLRGTGKYFSIVFYVLGVC